MNSPPHINDDTMAVVGFDIGNDTCLIAAARQGVVDVLDDDETPFFISFSEKQLLIGSSASSLLYPSSILSDIKDLVLSQPGSSYRVVFRKKLITVTAVHLLAMLLSRLKLISERSLGAPVSDCVISLPSFADQFGRRAYLQAAQLAGLKPLRLMHETTATALAYGFYKTDLSEGEIRVVFVDVGHCHTQVSVVAFNSDGLRALSHAADRRLGGRDFDEILFRHFSEQFKDEYQIDVSSNERASIQLKAECGKVKKDLSSNGEASMSIECLMDGKNVKGFIKREEFENLAAGLLERVLLPCKKALSDAGVGVAEVQSVELVGSASRIPAITKILSSFFGKEPSRTLNERECVARGCALQCAMLARGYKIKNYKVRDWLPHHVRFDFTTDMKFKKFLVRKGPLRSSRLVSLFLDKATPHLYGFCTHTDENGEPLDASQRIGSFSSAPPLRPLHTDPLVSFIIAIDIHGIVCFPSPARWLVDEIRDPVSGDASCSDSYLAGPSKVVEAITSNESEPSVDGQIKSSYRRFTYSIDMDLCGGFTDIQFMEVECPEEELAAQDNLAQRTENRKKELLSYVFDVLQSLLKRYETDTEWAAIEMSFASAEWWLLNEGADETEYVFDDDDDEMRNLQKLLEPVVNRIKDAEARPQATRELVQRIADNKLAAESLTAYKRDAVFNECEKAEQWLRDKSQLQDSLPKNSDPVLWSHEIKEMTASLDRSCKRTLERGEPPSES